MSKDKKGKHRTTGKKLKFSVSWLERFEEVEKVVLGIAESCRTTYPPGHLRYTRTVLGGIKLIGHSDNGVVDIFVKIEDSCKDELIKEIERKFQS